MTGPIDTPWAGLGPLHGELVASPDYLHAHGAPETSAPELLIACFQESAS
jgi:hypothetical protein